MWPTEPQSEGQGAWQAWKTGVVVPKTVTGSGLEPGLSPASCTPAPPRPALYRKPAVWHRPIAWIVGADRPEPQFPRLAVWPRVNDFISVLEFSALHGSWWYPPQRVLTRSIKLILAVTNIYLARQNKKGFTCLLKALMQSTRTTLSRSFPHIPISQIRKFRHREVE